MAIHKKVCFFQVTKKFNPPAKTFTFSGHIHFEISTAYAHSVDSIDFYRYRGVKINCTNLFQKHSNIVYYALKM